MEKSIVGGLSRSDNSCDRDLSGTIKGVLCGQDSRYDFSLARDFKTV